jgi:hypothetical protein
LTSFLLFVRKFSAAADIAHAKPQEKPPASIPGRVPHAGNGTANLQGNRFWRHVMTKSILSTPQLPTLPWSINMPENRHRP